MPKRGVSVCTGGQNVGNNYIVYVVRDILLLSPECLENYQLMELPNLITRIPITKLGSVN